MYSDQPSSPLGQNSFISPFFAGGIRGAALIHSPLLESKGRVSMDLMHLTDWLPTLYGRGGGDLSKLADLDGFDMWPTLSQGKASPRKGMVHNIDPVTWTVALRYQQWKLLANESMFLYDCACKPLS